MPAPAHIRPLYCLTRSPKLRAALKRSAEAAGDHFGLLRPQKPSPKPGLSEADMNAIIETARANLDNTIARNFESLAKEAEAAGRHDLAAGIRAKATEYRK